MTLTTVASFAIHRNRLRGAAASAVCALLLQGCGGGGGADTASVTDPPGSTTPPPPSSSPSPTNRAPTVSGTPATSVQAGQAYAFTPSATDADNDTLTFSIANKPSWATFNAATGQLSGTPAVADTFAGVTISVSDGTATASLSAFSISVTPASVTTGSASLSWTPPTQREDGSSLEKLAGYSIRYGMAAGLYTETINITNPGLTTYQVDDLKSGTYYFVVTAIDSLGYESQLSTPVSKTIS
jgi:hypothetical protein